MWGAAGCKDAMRGGESGLGPGGVSKDAVCDGESGLESGDDGRRLCKAG